MDGFAAQFAPCGIVEVDVEGRLRDANPQFLEWTGLSLHELEGRALTELIDDGDAMPRAADDQVTGPRGSRSVTVRLAHTDGSTRPVLISWRREGDRVVVALHDATKREEFENRITREHSLVARQERRLALLLRSSVRFADAMDEATLADELAEAAKDAYSATSSAVLLVGEGGEITTVAGSTELIATAHGKSLSQQAVQLRTVMTIPDVTEAPGIPAPIVTLLRDAGVRGLLVTPIMHETRQKGLLAVFFDHVRPFDSEAAPLADALTRQMGQALARIELTKELQRSAMLDAITGLPNRRVFEEQVQRAAQQDELVSVAFIDLDGFKQVNDSLGHDAGDQVLKEVAARIQSVIRDRDSVARFGGDEFVAVWTVPSVTSAEAVAERIRDAVAAPYDLPAGLGISASIGLAVSRVHPEPEVAERLVRVADQAMYRAKNDGGNRVVAHVG